MTTTPVAFDLAVLRRAIEERDAASQLALYAEDAEVELVDRDHPPSAPRILRGKAEIRDWIEDVSARDMTHHVEHEVQQENRAAFSEACQYPDGTRVLCSCMLELDRGKITRGVGIQVWDG